MSETEKLLNDIKAYLRLSAAVAYRTNAITVVDTYEKAIVFSKLDGKKTQTELAAEVGVSQPAISGWLTGFVQASLVAPPDQFNTSHRALFTLQELGIDVGTLKKRAKISKPDVQPSPATAAK
jgi:hypothetical protein